MAGAFYYPEANMTWHIFDWPVISIDSLGYLPSFLNERDPRSAVEQFNERYVFGGWKPFKGFKMKNLRLDYPGDPSIYPMAVTHLRDETIVVYPHAWVAVVQSDGSFEVCRMD